MDTANQKFDTPKEKTPSEYVQAIVYLLGERIHRLYDCALKRVPWYPIDEEKFNWARRVVEKRTFEEGEKSSPPEDEWPTPGNIPQPPREKTEEELVEERTKAWKRLEEIEKHNPGADTTTNAVNTVIARLIVSIYGRPPSDERVREQEQS